MTDETRSDAQTETRRADKDRRLAAALRANLARRKAQSRGRRSDAEEPGQKTHEGPTTSPGPATNNEQTTNNGQD